MCAACAQLIVLRACIACTCRASYVTGNATVVKRVDAVAQPEKWPLFDLELQRFLRQALASIDVRQILDIQRYLRRFVG